MNDKYSTSPSIAIPTGFAGANAEIPKTPPHLDVDLAVCYELAMRLLNVADRQSFSIDKICGNIVTTCNESADCKNVKPYTVRGKISEISDILESALAISENNLAVLQENVG